MASVLQTVEKNSKMLRAQITKKKRGGMSDEPEPPSCAYSPTQKLWLLMQAHPTDPLYAASHPDESTNKHPTPPGFYFTEGERRGEKTTMGWKDDNEKTHRRSRAHTSHKQKGKKRREK